MVIYLVSRKLCKYSQYVIEKIVKKKIYLFFLQHYFVGEDYRCTLVHHLYCCYLTLKILKYKMSIACLNNLIK